MREYVKWDDQPYDEDSLIESLYRAYKVSLTEPMGPVYICIDAELQEKKLDRVLKVPKAKKFSPPEIPPASLTQVYEIINLIKKSQMPVIIAEYLGRNEQAFYNLIEFSELIGSAVIDLGRGPLNFPNTSPLDILDPKNVLPKADLIISLDVKDLYGALTEVDNVSRESKYLINEDSKIINLGVFDFYIRSTITNYQRLQQIDISVFCDVSKTLHIMIQKIKEELLEKRELKKEIEERINVIKRIHDNEREAMVSKAKLSWNRKPISYPRLAYEIWQAIKDTDWIVAHGYIGNTSSWGWERVFWEFNKPKQHLGYSGGAGLGYGLPASIGVALALRNENKLVIDLQPDGDLLYTPTALWTAAHHNIPLLVIILNNKKYGNDWQHSYNIAKLRGRSTDNVRIGNEIDNPPVNFNLLAKSLGVISLDNPITSPNEIVKAVKVRVESVLRMKKAFVIEVLVE